jgi:16S rRNA (cytidine1402-2'-O)-methyltransferase
VIPIPGPSSLVTALSAAGLPTQSVLFLGFLPNRTAARRERLAEVGHVDATLVFFESPHRIGDLLADAAAELGAERAGAVCRELTKMHETVDRGTLGELASRYADVAVKGEIVFLIAPPGERPPPAEADVEAQLLAALKSMGVKEAARLVSEATGLSRRDLYQKALALKARG